MRNITTQLQITILIVALSFSSFAQTDCTQTGSVNCENGTNTNPDGTYTEPSSNSFKKNTFDWMTPTFPINKSDYQNFAPTIPANPLYSPFYSTASYLHYIAAGTDSDFKPEDGWELIKQDFGYIYSTSTEQWDGANIGSYNKPLAYFILYNKYSGILRVMATTPSQDGNADKVRVDLELINPSDPLWLNQSVYDNYTANGIFAHTTPVAKTLDEETMTNKASAFAAFPASTQDFFYADFQLAYDPCVCLFQSGIYVTFNKISTANVTLNGKLIGTSQSIATITNSSGSMFGDGDAGENYYTQFFAEAGTNDVKSIMQHYKDIGDLASAIAAQNGGTAPEIDNVKNSLKAVAVLFALGMKDPRVIAFKKSVEVLSKWVDFIAVLDKEDKVASPTVITAYMSLTGTAQTSTMLNGCDFYLATPGSCMSENRPEYAQASGNGVEPNYPMYNETVGLFALLESPTLLRKEGDIETHYNVSDISTCPGGGSLLYPTQSKKTILDYKLSYRLQGGTVKYALNPIVNESKTVIEAAIEIFGIEDVYNCNNSNEVISRTNYNAYFVDKNSANVPRYRTNFFPISCLEDIICQTKFSFIGDDGRFAVAQQKHIGQQMYIVFNIYYVFNVDEYGVEHFAFQTIKYPLTMEWTETDLESHANFIKLKNVPTDLILPATTYSTPNEIVFSRRTITITGDQVNNSGGQIRIIAETGIEVQPGVQIDPGISLELGELADFMCDNSQITNQLTTNELNTFCNSSTYKAKTFDASVTSKSRSGEVIQTTQYAVQVFPNPSDGIVNFAAESTIIRITVLSYDGKEVIITTHNSETGKIDLSDHAAGMYVIKLVSVDGHTSYRKVYRK